MALLIGGSASNNFGEKYFIAKAMDYFDDNTVIYWNRQLYGREFDVCILLPGKGILVLELKGWKEETVLGIGNNDSIIIDTGESQIYVNPQKQARGYRFSIERYIKQNIGKFPLVFHMVCLPQITRNFYALKRLDVVLEERFTLLKEDLLDKTSFFNKLNQALREVCNWNRDSFDSRTMLEVRNLFEADVCLENEAKEESDSNHLSLIPYYNHDYSRFYFVSGEGHLNKSVLDEMMSQYFLGCKLYLVLSNSIQLHEVVDALDAELQKRGLVRERDNIKINFDGVEENIPQQNSLSKTFSGFHCTISVLDTPNRVACGSFMIRNGQFSEAQEELLRELGDHSCFNVEQYLAEHADTEKNIVIRAGAGTGKTYTMISRMGFICYTQKAPLAKMVERIVMITFTNEAADQMKTKIKRYFMNCYFITSDPDYLNMIAQIDHMQISTIHSYAKKIISQLGTAFGYGVDLSITSSEFYRRKKISDILDSYVAQKERDYGKKYTDSLGMPIYAIRDSILDFIGKLHNKSVDICSIKAQDFGTLLPNDDHKELHELFASVIPQVEREYQEELLKNNRIHLSSMMSLLNKFVNAPGSEETIRELKKDKGIKQFMFVDEFQDTDDSQIESLMKLAEVLDYKLFVVGDVKQCIYRFRGAQEKAFDQLGIQLHPDKWIEFSLRRNYRTDMYLLKLFDRSFAMWGARADELLSYEAGTERLIGFKDYNGYLLNRPQTFYRKLQAANDEMRIPVLIEEIHRIQRRIEYEEARGREFTSEEKSIAILVRENWQAEMIRTECGRCGLSVRTNTGGDLYMSQPALDMMTLVNALVHFDEADYLYNFVSSNFFNLDIPKSNLFEIRREIRSGGWRTKADEKEQVNYLINFMNKMIIDPINSSKDWEHIVASLRTEPVLQIIRRIYSILEPWKNYSEDPWKQHYYQLNVDLLFEQLINACNVDGLTINTLQEYLFNSIVAQVSVDSRIPPTDNTETSIQCITVHKSKGLEYGHVILPFCSATIDYLKPSQLMVSTKKSDGRYLIGYRLNTGENGIPIQNGYYDDKSEKAEKAREETRILYVAMTRAIRSFSWIEVEGKNNMSWQNLIESEA